ncbi:MAG: ribosome silencing factor [Thermomicrobiales bacterium]
MENTAGIETTRELAVQIADIIAETPASDTRVIDIHELSPIADFFVVCSGENERQLRAINRAIDDELGKAGKQAKRIEGDATSGWILMDYSDVVVHIFDVDLRAFYRLEELWSDAPVLLSIL